MMTVYKYEIPMGDLFSVPMPAGAQILKFAKQHDALCIWAIVDTAAELETRVFRLAGTGHEIDNASSLSYIDTVLLSDGALVFHLFEILRG